MIDQSNKELLLGAVIDFSERSKIQSGGSRMDDIFFIVRAIIKGERISIENSSLTIRLSKESWFDLLKPYLCRRGCNICGKPVGYHVSFPYRVNPYVDKNREDHIFEAKGLSND